jgi:hypothetical protein
MSRTGGVPALEYICNVYLSSTRHKVVICRDLGPEVMRILQERNEIDVRLHHIV